MAKFEQRSENNGKHIDSHRYDQMSVADKQIVQRTRKESHLKDLPILAADKVRTLQMECSKCNFFIYLGYNTCNIMTCVTPVNSLLTTEDK